MLNKCPIIVTEKKVLFDIDESGPLKFWPAPKPKENLLRPEITNEATQMYLVKYFYCTSHFMVI